MMSTTVLTILLVVALIAFAAACLYAVAWRDACLRVEADRDRLRDRLAAYERIDAITLATRRAIRARVR